MRRKLTAYVTILVFFSLCLVPSLGLLVVGESGGSVREQVEQAPRWGGEVLTETANWLGNHFALRRELITLWARLNARLGTSVEEQVILGREGWLYFTPTLRDFTGEHLGAEELENIARHLSRLQREAEERGMTFLFTVAPNKNTLYPEYMPAWAQQRRGEGNLSLLTPYLDRYGVNYVDLTALDMPYYRTDSHWTAEGAAMAADTLLEALGYEGGFAAGEFEGQGLHRGDLFEMLYPAADGEETEIVYRPGFRFESLNDPNNGNAMVIRTACADGSGRLLCWRDSFGIALYPYLAERFETAEFRRSTDYTLPESGYDVVILEIVERNLNTLSEVYP